MSERMPPDRFRQSFQEADEDAAEEESADPEEVEASTSESTRTGVEEDPRSASFDVDTGGSSSGQTTGSDTTSSTTTATSTNTRSANQEDPRDIVDTGGDTPTDVGTTTTGSGGGGGTRRSPVEDDPRGQIDTTEPEQPVESEPTAESSDTTKTDTTAEETVQAGDTTVGVSGPGEPREADKPAGVERPGTEHTQQAKELEQRVIEENEAVTDESQVAVRVEDGQLVAFVPEGQAQREVAAEQISRETDLDVTPDDVQVVGDEVTLTQDFTREVAAQQFDEQLPGIDIDEGDVEQARAFSPTDPMTGAPGVSGPSDVSRPGFELSRTGVQEVESFSAGVNEELEDVFEGRFEAPETPSASPTTRAGRARIESQREQSAVRSELEQELEDETGVDLEPGQDFRVSQTEDGQFRAVLTESGQEKVAQEQRDPFVIDVPFVGEEGLDVTLHGPDRRPGASRTVTLPGEIEAPQQEDLGERETVEVGGVTVLRPVGEEVGVGPITFDLPDEVMGVPFAGAELEEIGTAQQQGAREFVESSPAADLEASDRPGPVAIGLGVGESIAGVIGSDETVEQVEAVETREAEFRSEAAKGVAVDIPSLVLGAPGTVAVGVEESLETGVGLAEGDVTAGQVSGQVGAVGGQAAQAAAESPGRTVGALVGSSIAMGGASLIGTRAGAATRFAIQPGEEIATVGISRAAPSVARRFPNNRIDNEEIVLRGAARAAEASASAARRGARGVAGAGVAGIRGVRTRSPVGVEFELDPAARLVEVDPELRTAIAETPTQFRAQAIEGASDVAGAVRRSAAEPRRRGQALRQRAGDVDPVGAVTGAAAGVRRSVLDPDLNLDPDIRARLAREGQAFELKALEIEDRITTGVERRALGVRQRAASFTDPIRGLSAPELSLDADLDVMGRLARERRAVNLRAAELRARGTVGVERAALGVRQRARQVRDPLERLTDPSFELSLDPDLNIRQRLVEETTAARFRAAELGARGTLGIERARLAARQQAGRATDPLERLTDPRFELSLDADIRGRLEQERTAARFKLEEFEARAVTEAERQAFGMRQRASDISPDLDLDVDPDFRSLLAEEPVRGAATVARRAAAAPTVRFTFEGGEARVPDAPSVPDEFAPERLRGLGMETETDAETGIDEVEASARETEADVADIESVDVETAGETAVLRPETEVEAPRGVGEEFDLRGRPSEFGRTEMADFKDGPSIPEVMVESSPTDVDRDVVTRPELDPVVEMPGEVELEAEATAGVDLETELESGLETETEVEAETEVELEAELELEAETETELELELEAETETELELETEFPMLRDDPDDARRDAGFGDFEREFEFGVADPDELLSDGVDADVSDLDASLDL